MVQIVRSPAKVASQTESVSGTQTLKKLEQSVQSLLYTGKGI